MIVSLVGGYPYTPGVLATLSGYARCSTDNQDLEANRRVLPDLRVAADRIYLDRAYSGTTQARLGVDQALAAVREGDTLVVPKLDQLARSVPDARQIDDCPVARRIRLQLGAMAYDPTDPLGKMFFNVLTTFAEFEVDLLPMPTRQGTAVARAKGKLKGRAPKLSPPRQALLLKLYAAAEHSIGDPAELFEVSRPTVYRVLERAEVAAR
jgi:DNA invertase Pin-like site-specific DNA recombinase